MVRWFLYFLAGFAWFGAEAQQYSLRQYMVLDGLPQSHVNMLLEDANGYLWIATHGGGLARFDGSEFKVYTTRDGLLSNTIQYLKLDNSQNLWIVHPRGITRFNGREFKKFQQPDQPSSRVRRVFQFRDSIFLVNNQGMLGKIMDDSVYYWSKPVAENKIILYTHLLPSRELCHYLNDSSFLIKTLKGDVVVSHKKQFSRLNNLFNVDKEVILKTENGFFVLDYLKGEMRRKEIPIANHILLYDNKTSVYWTRSNDDLLKEYFKNGRHYIDTVMREVTITQVLPDSEGNTWLGSSGKGLFKYFIQDFDRVASGMPDAVMAIEKDKDDMFWVGSGTKGLWRMANEKASIFNQKPFFENSVNSIKMTRTGDIWIGMYGGLGKYIRDQEKFKWFSRADGLLSVYINQVDCDEKGNIWVATNGGASYYDGKEFINYTTAEGLSGRNITAIRYSPYHKTVYAGSDNGLNAIRDGKVETIPLGEFENTFVQSINIYKQKWLLIGSGGAGLVVYNPTSHFMKFIDTQHGLPSDFIYFVAADEEDRIWVGTEKGISKIKLSESLEIVENLHYGFDNGLAGLETNKNAYYFGKEKYFGLIDGIYRYNDFSRKDQKSFPLHLTSVEVLNGQYDISEHADSLGGFFKIPYRLSLPSDKNHITFSFNRVDKRHPKSGRFQYYLENFDKAWSLPSSTGTVTYGNLPPGEYSFKVKSTDNKGSWDETPLTYTFVVLTPFYKTAAFRIGLLLIVAIGAALWIYFRLRGKINKVLEVQRIRQQEQDSLRKEIARDFHDEMGNQLTRIINYISLIKLNRNGSQVNGHDHELYNKVEESAKYLYSGTRDFIWSIDPVNDELSKLFLHIRDFGEKLFSEKEINFRAYNELKEKMHLPYGFSREANLIFKEAMTNSFNHSGAKNVSFTLKQEEDRFVMELQDDGCGFFMNDVAKLNGIKNMRSRADRMQATVRVKSAPGQGTLISLLFTITKNKEYELTI